MAAIDLKVREEKVKELADKIKFIQTEITEAETLADEFGIEMRLSLGGRSNYYTPARPEEVGPEDIEGTDWLESYDDYSYGSPGWSNSSDNC